MNVCMYDKHSFLSHLSWYETTNSPHGLYAQLFIWAPEGQRAISRVSFLPWNYTTLPVSAMGMSLTYLAIQCAVTKELFFNIYINLNIKSVNIKQTGAIYINTDM